MSEDISKDMLIEISDNISEKNVRKEYIKILFKT